MDNIIRNILPIIISLCIFLISCEKNVTTADYRNPELSIEERVEDLISRMTLSEKIDQLNMKSLNRLVFDSVGSVTDSSLEALFRSIKLNFPMIPNWPMAIWTLTMILALA